MTGPGQDGLAGRTTGRTAGGPMGGPAGNDLVAAAEASVRRYYDLVDAGDVPGVLDFFAADAVYHRPGYPPMVGREALAAFYGGERVIADGRHELDAVVVAAGEDAGPAASGPVTADGSAHDLTDGSGPAVAVRGRFVGTLKDGSPARVGFADFFVLDAELRAATRHSYFDRPAV